MQISDLKHLPVTNLIDLANESKVDNAGRMRKQDLIFAILKNKAKNGETLYGQGTLEVLPDGFGFLRSADTSYLAGPDDIYVSPSQIRRFNLHTGDTVAGEIRTPKDSERYFALVKVKKLMKNHLKIQRIKFSLKILRLYFQLRDSTSKETYPAKKILQAE